jgi:hypothetical protein
MHAKRKGSFIAAAHAHQRLQMHVVQPLSLFQMNAAL